MRKKEKWNPVPGGYDILGFLWLGIIIDGLGYLLWALAMQGSTSIRRLCASLFSFVSLCFGLIFHCAGLPIYLAFIFGGIALATAPAPALSIVREFKTKGPVTGTLIPMAALDDMVGVTVFFITISLVTRQLSGGTVSLLLVPAMILLIINLGAPLDYHAIFGAGVYSVVYIVSRAIGKYSGAGNGATITGMDENVRKHPDILEEIKKKILQLFWTVDAEQAQCLDYL